MYISDINTLITLPTPSGAGEYVVAGFYAPGDGGGGTFVWIPDSVAPALPKDEGIVWYLATNPSGSLGCFKRLYSGPINVRWFGAKGDGSTDDTAAVHAARDSQFCRDGGTIYFPQSKDSAGNVTAYVGAFEFLFAHGEVNIMGDGAATMLQSNGSLDANSDPNPVLRLGWAPWWWRPKRVFNLIINGTPDKSNPRFSDGIIFDDPAEPMNAGRWSIENVTLVNCNKGIFKPKGNIGNSYEGCLFAGNNFGYYAQTYTPIGLPGMHAGCDRFIGGHIEGSSHAGIYVHANGQYGQVIIDGTIIEYNQGFGIFIKTESEARATFTPVEIRNIWMEANALPSFHNKLIDNNGSEPVEKGEVKAHFNPVTNYLYLSVSFNGLSGYIASAGIYLSGSPIASLSNYPPSATSGSWTQKVLLSNPAYIADLYAGNLSVEINTSLTPEATAQLPPVSNITIDGNIYAPDQWRTLQFEGIRSVSISNTQVLDMKLIDASVKLNNCRSDRRFVNSHEWPYRIELNGNSQIIADDLIYENSVSENIFVNSISYDGTADILWDNTIHTSVWGPLRVVTQTGNKNILISQRYEDELFLFETVPSSGISQFTSTAKGGILHTFCAQLSCPVGIGYPELADVTNIAYLDEDSTKYYVWSIHAFWCRHEDGGDAAYGVIGSVADPNIQLGQVILKSNQWVCSYGVKKLNGSSSSPIPIYLRFGLSNG